MGGEYCVTELFDPIGSDASECGMRGAFVAFGATLPRARRIVHGLRERGTPGAGGGTHWNWRTGAGYVAPFAAPYDRTRRNGVSVAPLLFETFLSWGPGALELLHEEAAETRGNSLRAAEYDATTWPARTWMGFTAQRVSCALARAVV